MRYPHNSYQRYHAAHGAEEVEYAWMPNQKPYITPEERSRLITLFGPTAHPPLWIAGGSVVNPDSKDIDIWFLAGEKRAEWGEALTQYLKNVVTSGTFYERTEWQYKIPHMDKIGELVYATKGWRKLQFMVTEYEDVLTLLANFDISTHAWACDLDGAVVSGLTSTEVDMQPRVQVWDTPHSTLRRYITLCDRYHQKPHWGDVERLCECVVEVAKRQAEEKIKDLGV